MSMDTSPWWEGEQTVAKWRSFAKKQDEAFRKAVYLAHPEMAPPGFVISVKALDKSKPAIIRTEPAPPRMRFGGEDLSAQLRATRQANRRPVVRETVRTVADAYGVTPEQIMGRTRDAQAVRARHAVFYILSRGGYSSAAIGRIFDRDHSTVLNGCEKHTARMEAELGGPIQ